MSSRKRLTKQDLTLEFLVGTFFFGALIILAFFTILLSRDTLFGEEQILEVVFPAVAGLREGDSVLVHGVEVGTVDSMSLIKPGGDRTSAGAVNVKVSLGQPVPIYNDNTIEVRYSSVLGGRHLVIEPGTPATGKADLGSLTGTAPVDLMNEATRMVQSLREELENLKDNLRQGELIPKAVNLLDNLQTLTQGLREGKGSLGKLFADDRLYSDVTAALANAREAGEKIEQSAALGADILGDIKEGKGTLGRLVTEEGLYTDAQAVLKALRAGEGTLGKLLMEDTLHKDLRRIAADLAELLEDTASDDSTVGRFLSDEGKLYEVLLSAAKDIRVTMRQVREGEGTIGRLLTDPELYNETMKTVRSAKAAITDFREQAPVSTFGSLIFGAL